MDKGIKGRKIPLDLSVYNWHTGSSIGVETECDHDFDPKPTKNEDLYAEWTCTRCGVRRRYEVNE